MLSLGNPQVLVLTHGTDQGGIITCTASFTGPQVNHLMVLRPALSAVDIVGRAASRIVVLGCF